MAIAKNHNHFSKFLIDAGADALIENDFGMKVGPENYLARPCN